MAQPRPTQKSIREQNELLLTDARNRLQDAEHDVFRYEQALVAAKAVQASAQDALDQLEKRLNPKG